MRKNYTRYISYILLVTLIISIVICSTILEKNRYVGEVRFLSNSELTVDVYAYIHQMNSYYIPFIILGFVLMLYIPINLIKYLLFNYRGQRAHTMIFIILVNVGAIFTTYYGYSMVGTAESYLHRTGQVITPIIEIIFPFIAAITIVILVNFFTKRLEKRMDKAMENSPNIKNRIDWKEYMKK